MRPSFASTVVGVLLCLINGDTRAQAFELSVNCFSAGYVSPAIETFNPAVMAVIADADSVSRYVGFATAWDASRGGVGILATGFGMEFKTYHYNYDDAAATGKGPAYISSRAAFYNYCDLPGCYLDSDVFSTKNSIGEYTEPQVAFGMAPGAANSVVTGKVYSAWARTAAGRGNTSLLKVRTLATKLVAPGIGVSGYFLCRDIKPYNVLSFQAGVYTPTCFVKNTATGALKACGHTRPVNDFVLGTKPEADASNTPPATPNPVPPPAMCPAQVSRTGESEGLSLVVDLGASAGVVSVQFEAFGVPDALTVIQEQTGVKLLETGVVSGYASQTFSFNPGSGRNVRFKVDANQTAPTVWILKASCPGQPISSPVPRRVVTFSVQNNTCQASWKISLNGQAFTPELFATLTIGSQHLLRAMWTLPPGVTCGGTVGGSPGVMYVDDGRGLRSVIGAYDSNSVFFDVRP